MTIQLDHTIVEARDSREASAFLTEILGLPPAIRVGPFLAVEVDNSVSLDYRDSEGQVARQHYAFLISEAEFDEIFRRIKEHGITYWADPGQTRPGEINHGDGGRGFYFEDPNGHRLEVLTRRYGSSHWLSPVM